MEIHGSKFDSPFCLMCQPGQPGSGSTFNLAYTDSYNSGTFAGKCVTYDQYGDLKLSKDCASATSKETYIYNADKTLTVQGGTKSGQCVWSDGGTYPKFKACPSGTPDDDMVWDFVNGQLRSNGGTKCLVTWHGTVSTHDSSLVDYRLTMRDCPVLVSRVQRNLCVHSSGAVCSDSDFLSIRLLPNQKRRQPQHEQR